MERSPIDRRPLFAALGCFALWGLFPLMFQAMGRAGATPWEMLAWRTVVAVPFAVALVAWTRQGRAFAEVLGKPRQVGALALSGLMLGGNWAVYIWAVENQHTLAASLGYYINPLMNVAVAGLFFGERLRRASAVAVALATVGVALQAWAVGEVPWIPLILAGSFCLYSVIRKKASVESQTGLLVECLVLAAPCAVYLAWLTMAGDGIFGQRVDATLLLLLGGPVTVFPLFLFGYAARRLPLTAIGFIQFITPTLLFVIGWAQGEPLTALRLAAFAFIWAGVAVFAWGSLWASPLPWRGREGPAA